MHKNWNQRVDIKIDNRLIGVKFVNAEKYNSTIQMWEILSGVIHMNVGEYGRRPTDRIVCRFDARLYDGQLGLDLKPVAGRAKQCVTTILNPFMSHDGTRLEVPIDWIRQQIATTWNSIMHQQGDPILLSPLPESMTNANS